jgi:hypothetical protein
LENITEPGPTLQRVRALDELRAKTVKDQSPEIRLPKPVFTMEKIALITDAKIEDLSEAFRQLNALHPSSAWRDLISE